MGVPVLIVGESGSGKSASLRNFDPDEAVILNVTAKLLPFRKKMNLVYDNCDYGIIYRAFRSPTFKDKKVFVIDDSQYLMSFELFDKVSQNGYEKFTQLAANFKALIDYVNRNLPPDVIVYFLHHAEMVGEFKQKAKTVGKMLDNQLTLEGMFSIVLFCVAEQGEHVFITQSDGTNTAKSPMEMFDERIDNDLKMVDTTIRKYYDLGGINHEEVESE